MSFTYQPAEDTWLLINKARDLIHRVSRPLRILELGSGPGSVARELLSAFPGKISRYVGIDLNPTALAEARKAVPHAFFLKADATRLTPRFLEEKGLPGVYDLILINPPYLPAGDEILSEAERLALIGGKQGYEALHAFLHAARHLLHPHGRMIALTSSLSKPSVTRSFIREEGFHILREEVMPIGLFERLHAFALRMSPRLQAARMLGLSGFTHFTRGWHSLLSRAWHRDAGWLVLKETLRERVLREAFLFETLQQHQTEGVIIPRPWQVFLPQPDAWNEAYAEAVLILPYYEGGAFSKLSREAQEALFPRYLSMLERLDRLGIIKRESSRPGRNVLVTPQHELVVLDFERAKAYSKREYALRERLGCGRNVREACEYARRQGWRVRDCACLDRFSLPDKKHEA